MTTVATTGTPKPRRRRTTPNNSRTTKVAIERRERDLQCVNLRRAGLGWQAIADQLNYASPGHAHERFMVFMREYPREDVETARDLEADRLDEAQRAIWVRCVKGDLQALDRLLKLSAQRAKLLGLNAQVRDDDGLDQVGSMLAGLAAQLGLDPPE